MPEPLTDLDRAILNLAANPPRDAGGVANKIRDLNLDAADPLTAYAHRLSALLDTEAALAEFPTTVNRLRRLRQSRSNNRWDTDPGLTLAKAGGAATTRATRPNKPESGADR